MKKLVMTFAIVAFLLGGFVTTAQAQTNNTKDDAKDNKNKKEVVVNYDKMIQEYELNVDKYIAAYEKALKAGNLEKSDYPLYMKKAQELQTKLENAKAKMTKEQWDLFTKVKEKFTKALTRK